VLRAPVAPRCFPSFVVVVVVVVFFGHARLFLHGDTTTLEIAFFGVGVAGTLSLAAHRRENAALHGVDADRDDQEFAGAGHDVGSGKQEGVFVDDGGLFDEDGFSRESGLVHFDVGAFQQDAVRRHDVAHGHAHDVADDEILGRHVDDLSFADDVERGV